MSCLQSTSQNLAFIIHLASYSFESCYSSWSFFVLSISNQSLFCFGPQSTVNLYQSISWVILMYCNRFQKNKKSANVRFFLLSNTRYFLLFIAILKATIDSSIVPAYINDTFTLDAKFGSVKNLIFSSSFCKFYLHFLFVLLYCIDNCAVTFF